MKPPIILLLCLTASSCSRHLGSYCSPPNLTAWCFTFDKDNAFSFASASCTSGYRGTGRYEIKEDSLRFYFSQPEYRPGKVEAQKVDTLSRDISVDLLVLDVETKETLIGYTAAFFQDGKLLTGAVGNTDGKATLRMPFENNPVQLRISYSGYQQQELTLNEPGRYHIHCALPFVDAAFIQPQTWEYKFWTWNRKKFVYSEWNDPKHRIILRKIQKP